MIKKILIVLIIITVGINASDEKKKVYLMKQYNFAQKTINYLEGYSESIGQNDLSYFSLRNDVTEGMLTRCTDGEMAIEWQTQIVPNDYKGKGAWFTWLTALDLTSDQHNFDVFVNDVKRFTFFSSEDEDKQFSNKDGGKLEYLTIQKDQHDDSHGYMSMYAPTEWITPGEPLKIKIVGESAGAVTWIIVFKAKDALSYLHEIVEYETWLNVEIDVQKDLSRFRITAPKNYSGSNLNYKVGNEEGSVEIKLDGEKTIGQFLINRNIQNDNFSLWDNNDELLQINSLNEETKKQRLLSNSLLLNELKLDGEKITIKVERIYKPHTVNNLLHLADSKLSSGKIYLMNSSHQDIAWMDTPEKCVIERDTMLLAPLYEKALSADSDYRFDVEDALMLKEFIQRHPEKKEGIAKLLKEGKISCGSSYIQPYEEMYSGEALIRQFYFGTKWLKKEFNYDARVYWNVDVPGRVLQMPQIIKKSGTDYMVISRHEKGIFNWYSPDSSFVTTYTPGHYANSYTALHKNVYEAANFLAEFAMDWEQYYSKKSSLNIVPVLSDWDMSPAKDYSHIINNWESINQLEKENGEKIDIQLPKFQLATAEEFLNDFVKSADKIPSIKGERPAVWLYIHGPSHYQALKASREGDIFLTMAEKFATIDALTNKSFINYPAERLSNAWEAKIYPDHGWGGKGGEITDALFLKKFTFARDEGKRIFENAAKSVASKVVTNSDNGTPLIVFNSLSWVRTDLANFTLNFAEGVANSISLKDADGKNVESQLTEIQNHSDGTIKSATLNFIAEEIPSVGYKTYYTKTAIEKKSSSNLVSDESEFYKIKLGNGGVQSIYDKELDKELLDVSKFLGGEIFTMKSEGHGAGEFADVQQPTMDGFDKTSNYETEWELIENGQVFSTFKMRQQIRNAVVEQKIILFKKIKRIDFEISLLNWEGVLYREYRLALPINMNDGQVSYETAFGVSEVGKDEIEGAAGERYTSQCKDVHPRGIENWIGVSNDDFGVTLSSCVAVADYIDPTDNPSENTILQPLLLASRRSCHGEGNEYLQTGDHHYSFSLTSHQSGWKNGFAFGKQANEKLQVVVNPKQYANAALPEEKSFFSTKGGNAIISTIKKGEDDNSTVIRFYDLLGEDSKTQLHSFKNIKKALHTNLIEEEIENLEINNSIIPFNLGHHSIETMKLYFSD